MIEPRGEYVLSLRCLVLYYDILGVAKDVAKSLATGIKSYGFSVEIEKLGKQALRKLSTEQHDLVVIGTAHFVLTPPNIFSFIRKMPRGPEDKVNPVLAFLVGTRIGMSRYFKKLRTLLQKKNYTVIREFFAEVQGFPPRVPSEYLAMAERYGWKVASYVDAHRYKFTRRSRVLLSTDLSPRLNST